MSDSESSGDGHKAKKKRKCCKNRCCLIFKEEFKMWAQEVSLCGPQRIAFGRYKALVVIWILLFLLSLVLGIFVCVEIFETFWVDQNEDTESETIITEKNYLQFPLVRFCPSGLIHRSKLKNTLQDAAYLKSHPKEFYQFKYLSTLTQGWILSQWVKDKLICTDFFGEELCRQIYTLKGGKRPKDGKLSLENVRSIVPTLLKYHYLQFDRETKLRITETIKEAVIYCNYDGIDCFNYLRYVDVPKYGLCIEFANDATKLAGFRQDEANENGGLELVFHSSVIEQSLLQWESGITVLAVHEKNTYYTEAAALPGSHTKIQLHKDVQYFCSDVTRCHVCVSVDKYATNEERKIVFQSPPNEPMYPVYMRYKVLNITYPNVEVFSEYDCLQDCLFHRILENCQCKLLVADFLDDAVRHGHSSQICFTSFQYECAFRTLTAFNKETQNFNEDVMQRQRNLRNKRSYTPCYCYPPCSIIRFPMKVTKAMFPSKMSFWQIWQLYKHTRDKKTTNMTSYEEVTKTKKDRKEFNEFFEIRRKTFTKISVYFNDLDSTRTVEHLKWPLIDILTYVGGILAFLMAFCILFLMEILEFIIKLIRHYVLYYQWKKKIKKAKEREEARAKAEEERRIRREKRRQTKADEEKSKVE